MTILDIIAPAFSAIGIGFLLGRRYSLDTGVLSKLLIHVLVPAAILGLAIEVDPQVIAGAGMFVLAYLVHSALLAGAGFAAGAFSPLAGYGRLLALGAMIYNLGNFGVPMLLLAGLREEAALAGSALVVQIVLTFMIGIPLLSGQGVRRGLSELVRYPIIWVILVSALIVILQPVLPSPVVGTLDFLARALPAVALLTVGIQLTRVREGERVHRLFVVTVLVLRHVLSPLLALAVAWAMGLSPYQTRTLVIISLMPVATNVYVLAEEFDSNPGDAARAVGISTLLSAVTIPFLIA